MARREDFISLPTFPGLALRQVELARGYEFGKPRGSKVEIFKKPGTQARQKTPVATVECVCQGAGGGCLIEVVGGLALCLNDTCKNCTWKVKVPTSAFGGYLGDVFQEAPPAGRAKRSPR